MFSLGLLIILSCLNVLVWVVLLFFGFFLVSVSWLFVKTQFLSWIKYLLVFLINQVCFLNSLVDDVVWFLVVNVSVVSVKVVFVVKCHETFLAFVLSTVESFKLVDFGVSGFSYWCSDWHHQCYLSWIVVSLRLLRVSLSISSLYSWRV